MPVNIERTRQYYDHLTEADLCSCAYCRNYIREIKTACPELAAWLSNIAVDIEKPFEVIPIGPADGTMYYSGVQYVVLGTVDDFKETSVAGVQVFITDSHPMTDITEEHFVIETSSILLRWTDGQSGI